MADTEIILSRAYWQIKALLISRGSQKFDSTVAGEAIFRSIYIHTWRIKRNIDHFREMISTDTITVMTRLKSYFEALSFGLSSNGKKQSLQI